MKTLILLIAISLFSGCASMTSIGNKGNGYIIKQDRAIWPNIVRLEYKDNALLRQESVEEMNLRMIGSDSNVSPEPIEYSQIMVRYEAHTLQAANTKWLEYVILKDGKEIYRTKGDNQIPSPSAWGGMWMNFDAVFIPKDLEAPFTFVVIDHITQKRDIFTITK